MYNEKKITSNMFRISIISTIASIVSMGVQFGYRTFFLFILSKEYLGIEGLFSNIIQILSLSELGIGTIIAYRLYEPIKNKKNDVVASIMGFYRKIYAIIAMIVAATGIFLFPFLKFLVKDASEIPSDVNFYIVYTLFLAQSISTYFFSYKQTLLTADQRGDLVAIFNTGISLLKGVIQLCVLYFTHNYQYVLASAIILLVTSNWLFSIYITKQYYDIFKIKIDIDKRLKNNIFRDVRASVCHKIGGVVSTSTDNIVLSAFVGLGKLGLYSNYVLLIEAAKMIVVQLLGNFTASVGRANLTMGKQEYYNFYEKLLVINFAIVDIVTVCLVVLINPFMIIWQGKDMIFSNTEIIIIIACFYLNTVRLINISFTNANGMYVKDIARPLIEVIINLILSVTLTIRFGMIGVFIGTIVSHLTTVGWREPYIIYKYVFHKSVFRYFYLYIFNGIAVSLVCFAIKEYFCLEITDLFLWIIQAIITVALSSMLFLVLYLKYVKDDIKLVLKRN